MGELQRKLPTHISKIYYPIDRRAVRRARAGDDPARGDRAGGGGDLAEFPLARARPGHSAVPGQCAAVGALLSRLPAVRVSVPAAVRRVWRASGRKTRRTPRRLRELGCRPEAIHIVGSLKFDAAKLDERRLLDVPALLRQLGVKPGARLLVGGSTHAGEEAILAEQFLRLRARFPDLFLVLVPRHFERSREVGRELEARGVKFVYRSEITSRTQFAPGEIDCLLVNTTGELKYFYEHATVIFVGKSLTAEGRPEPDRAGRAGQSDGLRAEHAELRGGGPAVSWSRTARCRCGTRRNWRRSLGELLADERAPRAAGPERAEGGAARTSGAIDRTVDMIVEHLDGRRAVRRAARRPTAS